MKFKVTLTYGRSEMDEFHRLAGKTEQKGKIIRMRLLYLVFVALGLVGSGYLWNMGGQFRFLIPLTLLFSGFFLHRIINFYSYMLSSIEGRSAKTLSSIDFTFVDAGFQAKNQYQASEFLYDNVLSIYETDLSFVLFMTRAEGYILRKDAFVQGKPEAFKSFIEEKCQQDVKYVKVEIPVKAEKPEKKKK